MSSTSAADAPRSPALGPSPTPEISVVLACFDQTRELELTLLSFLRQDFPQDRYELIVVDDHSPDHSARKVVARLRHSFPDASIHYLRQHRQDGGEYFSSALVKNLGTRLARGRYVWFNNAEIVQAGESLQYVSQQHREEPGPLCLRGRVIDLPFEQLWGKTQAELDSLHDATDRGRERVATADHAGLASMRRDILVALGGNDERFDHWGKEDLDLAARLKRVGVTYRYDEEVKSFHISHPPNHVKGPDYDRMCRLLEENNSREVVEVNRGYLWGERTLAPAESFDGTLILAAGDGTEDDLGDLEQRLETALYGDGGERCEVLVACLDEHRPAVEERLEQRFLAVPCIALAGADTADDARRTLARIRTESAALWLPKASDPRPAWHPIPAVAKQLEAWLDRSTHPNEALAAAE
ncbi:MAG: glycosyltransferase [Acidobacteriota bacterium]|nr:glycosyltransferase [Acidobacteriota bacterium]